MYIRIKKNGVYSDWFQNTKKIHRSLLTDPPETVQIWLEEVYPGSPDSSEPTEVPFEIFNTITREAVLEENRYLKRLARYHDPRPLDDFTLSKEAAVVSDIEEQYIQKEQTQKLWESCDLLTPTQWRRIKLRIIDHLTYPQIAVMENVRWETVRDSIHNAWRKLKKILN